jgi:HEAT repeat protein
MTATMQAARLLAAALCATLGTSLSHGAVPWSAQAGTTRVLLVAVDPPAQAELRNLAEVLKRHYGAGGDTTRELFGENARADDIERALFELSPRTSPRDTLVVVLALPLFNKSGGHADRILVTHDFNPEKPWTGLSLDLLGKLASASAAGNFWQFTPDCSPEMAKGGQRYEQRASSNKGTSESGMASITFCEDGGTAPGTRFVRTLSRTLEEAARDRGDQLSAGEVNVPLIEVFGRLSKNARDFSVANDYLLSRNAILRLRPASLEPQGAEIFRALVEAESDFDAIRVLDRAVEQGRATKTPGNAEDIANALVNFSIKTHADANRRARAIQALGSLPGEVARPALERTFREADPGDGKVRANALREWQRIARSGDFTLAKQGLKDGDSTVVVAALGIFGIAADLTARDDIVNALKTASNTLVRSSAASALTSLAGKDDAFAEAVLLDSLKDSDEAVRASAAGSLAKLQLSPGSVGPLLAMANREDESALGRENAVYALASAFPRLPAAEQQRVERELARFVSNARQPEGLRTAAIYTMAQGKSPNASKHMTRIAADRGEVISVRSAAMKAVGELHAVSAIPTLARIAGDAQEKIEIRVTATATLGYLQEDKAVEVLLKLRESDTSAVAAAARRGLELAQSFSATAASTLADPGATVEQRVAAARLLGNSTDMRAFDPLVAALADPRTAVREAAIASLARFKDKQYLDRLAEILATPEVKDDVTHEGVGYALAAMDTPEARQILEHHVDHKDRDVRLAVAKGLGTAKSTASGVEALRRLAKDKSDRVRTSAAVSLGRIENIDVREILESMAKDEDSDVSAAAVESMRMVLARHNSLPRAY